MTLHFQIKQKFVIFQFQIAMSRGGLLKRSRSNKLKKKGSKDISKILGIGEQKPS